MMKIESQTVRIEIGNPPPVIPCKEFAGCFNAMSSVQECERMVGIEQLKVVIDSQRS